MKIETFIISSLVVGVVFILGLMLIGEGINNYGGTVMDSELTSIKNNLTIVFDTTDSNSYFYNSSKDLETETLEKSSDTGQMDRSDETTDISYWTYTTRSLRAATKAISTINPTQRSLTSVLDYFGVNPLIITTIITVLVIMAGFAFISWWKGNKL